MDLKSRTSSDSVILHVTESFASGTASAIADIVRNYPRAKHHLLYALRDVANVDPRELQRFHTATAMPDGHVARIAFLRRLLRQDTGITHVHAHSSKAGVYVRAAAPRSRERPILYTPHCYAFERLDVGWSTRQLFRAVEWLLSFNTSAYGACSPREASLSLWPGSSPPVVLLPNVMPPGLPTSTRGSRTDLCIVGNGRLGPQKDPAFFADAFAAAAKVHPGLRALWVGGGEERYVRRLEESGVEVTGWLTRTDALAAMAACDVYLHTALWEGFPVSIMEAAAMGLPVVARRRPYLAGVDMPLVIDRPDELAAAIHRLRVPSEFEAMQDATSSALQDHNDSQQQLALKTLYGTPAGATR